MDTRTSGSTAVITAGDLVVTADDASFRLKVVPDAQPDNVGAYDVLLQVQRGTATFAGRGRRETVPRNQESEAQPGQPPSRPQAISPDQRIHFEPALENFPLPLPRLWPRTGLAELQRVASGVRSGAPLLAGGSPTAAADATETRLAHAQTLYDLNELTRAEQEFAGIPDPRALAGHALTLIAQAQAEAEDGHENSAEDLAKRAAASAARLQAEDPGGPVGPLLVALAALARPLPPESSRQAGNRPGSQKASTAPNEEALKALDDSVKAVEQIASHRVPLSDLDAPWAFRAVLRAAGSPDTLPQARAELQAYIARHEGAFLARQALGAVLMFLGETTDAERELEAAMCLATENQRGTTPIRLQLARIRAVRDDLPGAEAELREIFAAEPENAGAHLTFAMLFAARQDLDTAEQEFRRVLVSPSFRAAALTGLSGIDIQRGSLRRALKSQQAALDLSPGSPQAHNNRGLVYLLQGHLTQAISEFDEALRLTGQHYPLALANRATARLEQNNYAMALHDAQEAARQGEHSAQIHTLLARIYLKQNRLDRALSQLRLAEARDPYYPLLHFYLAQLYRVQGRDRDGLRALLRGLALDPGTAAEQRQYARTETNQGLGTHGDLHTLRSDDRLDRGRLTYYLSGAITSADAGRDESDRDNRFGEVITGYRPDDRRTFAFVGAFLDEAGARPGRRVAERSVPARTGSGSGERPVPPLEDTTNAEFLGFDRAFNAGNFQLLHRWEISRADALTFDMGYRHSGVFLENSRSMVAPNPLRLIQELDQREGVLFGETLWERSLDRWSQLRVGLAGASLDDRSRGRFLNPLDSLGSETLRSNAKLMRDSGVAWGEYHRQVNSRFDVTGGFQGGTRPNRAAQYGARFAGRYRLPSGTTFALLSYPVFQPELADLLNVETWSRPARTANLPQVGEGSTSNYELSMEHPLGALSLFSGSVFYRRLRDYTLFGGDPDLSPVIPTFPVADGELWGGTAAVEKALGATWSVRLSGDYTASRDRRTGQELLYVPQWGAGLRIDYAGRAGAGRSDLRADAGRPGLRAGAGLTYVGPRFADLNPRQTRLAGYLTTDLGVVWQQDLHWSYFVTITDLLDRAPAFYRGYPGAGRTILGGVNIRF